VNLVPNKSIEKFNFFQLFKKGSFISLVLLILIFSIYASTASNVFTVFSMNNLLNNSIALALAAIGLTLVILTGGTDFSVGSVIILANVIIASQGAVTGGEVAANLTVVFLTCIGVGMVNGFFISYVGIQPIATTLATMIMCQGIALVVMPAPGGSVSPLIYSGLTSTVFGILPMALVILVLAGFIWVVIKKTSFGTHIYAIGEDERASIQAGINVKRVKFLVYVVASLFYALAGVMYSAQTGSGDPTAGSLFTLLVFAAVALGGTQFVGGKGGAFGSIVGALILTLLQKMLFSVGVSSFYTSIFQGFVLIAAIMLGRVSAKINKWGEL